jgi:hypothetical protein
MRISADFGGRVEDNSNTVTRGEVSICSKIFLPPLSSPAIHKFETATNSAALSIRPILRGTNRAGLSEIPKGKIPLFGDCFNKATKEQQEEFCRIEVVDGKQYINSDATAHVEYLDLGETDCIYGSEFGMMIKEAFRADKNFVVAKLKSRGTDNFDMDYTSKYDLQTEIFKILDQQGEVLNNFFNVYSIIKLLVRKRGDDFVGRYHPDSAIASLNPLTNNKIIGEVEFYLI